jgi:hypothetical protein
VRTKATEFFSVVLVPYNDDYNEGILNLIEATYLPDPTIDP